MSLSASEIAQVLQELSSLEGAAIQRTWSPEQSTCLLALRGRGRSWLLLVSAETNLTRIHLTGSRPRPRGEPAPFQDATRAEIEGLRLVRIEQVPGERIVRMSLDGRHSRTLVAELMGRRGNLIILDETDSILHAALPERRAGRVIGRGERYEPPTAPATAREPRPSRFADVASTDSGSRVNEAVDELYSSLAEESRVQERRRFMLRPVERAARRVERALERLSEEERRAQDADVFRRYGELLKPALHQVKRGAEEARVVDWYEEGAPKVTIPLRPELSPKENMDRYFKLHGRLKAAPERIASRRAVLLRRRDRLGVLLGNIGEATDERELQALEPMLVELALEPSGGKAEARVKRKHSEPERKPYRKFASVTGRPILVGRGGRDNDELTFKVARGNDVWMHVRGQPGSHVVVPTAGLGEPDDQTLLDAATLAAHFSRARGEGVVDVAWTWRKHVRKPKKAAPGKVLVSQERGLLLRLERDRLRRLLDGVA